MVGWCGMVEACSRAEGEFWGMGGGTVSWCGTGWPCWTAVMERGVSGGGTIALLWHGVVVPLLWFDTAEICGECVAPVLWSFVCSGVFG